MNRKERPIIFNPEMVAAILNRKKTQTRRIMKIQPDIFKLSRFNGHSWEFSVGGQFGYDLPICPYGKIGDNLWVREPFGYSQVESAPKIIFKADFPDLKQQWKSSLYLPRHESRLLLRIEDLKVQRLQDISEQEAQKEGCNGLIMQHLYNEHPQRTLQPIEHFAYVWDCLNAKRELGVHSWISNPFVWVVEFSVL